MLRSTHFWRKGGFKPKLFDLAGNTIGPATVTGYHVKPTSTYVTLKEYEGKLFLYKRDRNPSRMTKGRTIEHCFLNLKCYCKSVVPVPNGDVGMQLKRSYTRGWIRHVEVTPHSVYILLDYVNVPIEARVDPSKPNEPPAPLLLPPHDTPIHIQGSDKNAVRRADPDRLTPGDLVDVLVSSWMFGQDIQLAA